MFAQVLTAFANHVAHVYRHVLKPTEMSSLDGIWKRELNWKTVISTIPFFPLARRNGWETSLPCNIICNIVASRFVREATNSKFSCSALYRVWSRFGDIWTGKFASLAMSVNQLESMEALDRSGGSLERNNRGNSAGGWRPITGAQHRSAATLNPEKSPFRSAGWIRAARSPTVPILEYISRFELYIWNVCPLIGFLDPFQTLQPFGLMPDYRT